MSGNNIFNNIGAVTPVPNTGIKSLLSIFVGDSTSTYEVIMVNMRGNQKENMQLSQAFSSQLYGIKFGKPIVSLTFNCINPVAIGCNGSNSAPSTKNALPPGENFSVLGAPNNTSSSSNQNGSGYKGLDDIQGLLDKGIFLEMAMTYGTTNVKGVLTQIDFNVVQPLGSFSISMIGIKQ